MHPKQKRCSCLVRGPANSKHTHTSVLFKEYKKDKTGDVGDGWCPGKAFRKPPAVACGRSHRTTKLRPKSAPPARLMTRGDHQIKCTNRARATSNITSHDGRLHRAPAKKHLERDIRHHCPVNEVVGCCTRPNGAETDEPADCRPA